MPIGEANDVTLRFLAESTYGTVPAGSKFKDLRITGESLGADTTVENSNELNSRRNIRDVYRANVGASGDINFELTYGTFDDLFAYMLMVSAWTTGAALVTATTISFAAPDGNGDQVITDSGSGFGSLVAPGWVWVSGAGNTENNGVFKMSSSNAGAMAIHNPGGVSEPGGATVKIKEGDTIVNGKSLTSVSIEREHTDIANTFAILNGMVPGTMNMDVNEKNIVTGRFGFQGKNEAPATATSGDGSPTAAPTNRAYNAVDNVTSILEGGAETDITRLALSVNNGLRPRGKVGELGPFSMGKSRINVNGSFTRYFDTNALAIKAANFTETSVALIMNRDSKVYVVEVPSARITNLRRVGGNVDQDVLYEVSFQGHENSTELITIRMARFDNPF